MANEHWAKEQGLSPEKALEYKQEIHDFISNKDLCMGYMMTRRKDGREIMRPVSTILDNWLVHTMTQDIQPKTTHIKNDPIVGYLWVGKETRDDHRWNPKVVWMQGTAELIQDQSQVNDFYAMREEKYGIGRSHSSEDTLFLVKTNPEYVRAEGWHGQNAIIYKEF
tara:strand:+ start:99 stop:596 length:498 start_codon:yes stop_codon:yes gene_type:complete